MRGIVQYINESSKDYSKMSLKKFIDDNKYYAKLIQVVFDQMDMDEEYFFSNMDNVANHGASGGYNGFIYYKETVKFFEDNKNLIKKLAIEQADEFGNEDYAEMVTHFNDFKNYDYNRYDVYDIFDDYVDWDEAEEYDGVTEKEEDDLVELKNLMAWYALEEVAHMWERWQEDLED